MQPIKIFRVSDLETICSLFESYDIADYYLTWRTEPMLQELSNYKLDQSNSLLHSGLRWEHAVGCERDLSKALGFYQLATDLHLNLVAFCKKLCIMMKHTPEQLASCDELVYEFMRCLTHSSNFVAANLWSDLLKQPISFEGRLLQLLTLRVNSHPEANEPLFLLELFKLWGSDTTYTYNHFIQKNKKFVIDSGYIPAAEALIFAIQQKGPSTPQELAFVLQCAQLITDNKHYRSYVVVGKLFHIIGRHADCVGVLQEGANNHFWECRKLLLSIRKEAYQETNYRELAELLQDEMDSVLCYGNRSEFYDFIYMYNLVRFKSKQPIPPHIVFFYKELCKVCERFRKSNDDSFMVLDTEYVIQVYFDEELSLEERIRLITEQSNGLKGENDQRIALYHLMRLWSKQAKAIPPTASHSQRTSIQAMSISSQRQFISYTNQTVRNDEFPTAIYRLAKCYEKGYGVQRNLAVSYLLLVKTMEQAKTKYSESLNVFNMSFLNAFSRTEARRKLKRIGESPEVVALKKRIQANLVEQPFCAICTEVASNTILYPCMHMFCERCLEKLPHPKCPMCRANIMMQLSLESYGLGYELKK